MTEQRNVVVVGAGNAALSAALSAAEQGAQVTVLESAGENDRGGNSFFTGGLYRFPQYGIEDLCELLPELGDGDVSDLILEPFTEEDFIDEMGRLTQYRTDPDLLGVLVGKARETITWLHNQGMRFGWSRGRHAHKVGDKFQFWGGAPLEVVGGGAGIIEQLFKAVDRNGIKVQYGTRATGLIMKDGAIAGVRAAVDSVEIEIEADAVVLACGGFEANPELRARYLGVNWDLVKVRGSKHNRGDGIVMATDVGARPYGHWSGCHATAWDANAPLTGDRSMGDAFSRHSYPLGIVVNREGRRFVDEGEDFHTQTYAKYGAAVLRQTGITAYQIFDAKTTHFLRSDYRERRATKVTADTIAELAVGLQLDPETLQATVDEFNAATSGGDFNPNIKDGVRTRGLNPDKSNWAQPLDAPPFVGYTVTTGITFTFGGLRIDEDSRVLDWSDKPIPGLFAAGELIGGLFYHNYPSGTGLMAGAVFGRRAGVNAAGGQA
jgi:tricarballylate dehydrogenase